MALRAIDGSLRTGPSKLECYMAQSKAAYCPKIHLFVILYRIYGFKKTAVKLHQQTM